MQMQKRVLWEKCHMWKLILSYKKIGCKLDINNKVCNDLIELALNSDENTSIA